jgi:hypothetical protein
VIKYEIESSHPLKSLGVILKMNHKLHNLTEVMHRYSKLKKLFINQKHSSIRGSKIQEQAPTKPKNGKFSPKTNKMRQKWSKGMIILDKKEFLEPSSSTFLETLKGESKQDQRGRNYHQNDSNPRLMHKPLTKIRMGEALRLASEI